MLVNVPQGNECIGTVRLDYMLKVQFRCSRCGSNVQGFVQNVLVLEVKEVD